MGIFLKKTGEFNSYWWTSPSLNEDSDGAKIVDFWKSEIIYASAEIRAHERMREYQIIREHQTDFQHQDTEISYYISKKYEKFIEGHNESKVIIKSI